MCRHLLVLSFVILQAGCGTEQGTAPQATNPPAPAAPALDDQQARKQYQEQIQKAHQLVRDAAELLDGIAAASEARKARLELDKLSDEMALVAREMVTLGVDITGDITYHKKRVEFFATQEKLRGAVVPLQANDSAWRVMRPSVDRFKQELDKLNLGI